MASTLGLPKGMSRDDAYIQGVADGEAQAVQIIKAHIPSLTDDADTEINERMLRMLSDPEPDNADLAFRICRCGELVDGFYAYVDHLITVLGGESHLAG